MNWWLRKVYLKLGRRTRKGVAACSQRGLILVLLRGSRRGRALALCGDVAFSCGATRRLGLARSRCLGPRSLTRDMPKIYRDTSDQPTRLPKRRAVQTCSGSLPKTTVTVSQDNRWLGGQGIVASCCFCASSFELVWLTVQDIQAFELILP